MSTEKPTFLFIPDISGFTRFVSKTEAEHSRHIISELLEIIVSQDTLGLKVSEIEGDAVLFYKQGIPTVSDIIRQAQKTFLAFHNHLRRYETERVCRCGACRTASALSLKFIAHAGKISFLKIAGHEKLHGHDNILVHKLLKNSIPGHEYLLLTNELDSGEIAPEIIVERSWVKLLNGNTDYDDFGEIKYRYIPLAPLHHFLDETQAPGLPLGPVKINLKRTINAPVDQLYFNITDLEIKKKWNPKIKDITNHDELLDKTGTTHTCLINNSSLDFKVLGRKENQDEIAYGERIESFMGLKEINRVFILRGHKNHTHLELRVDYKLKRRRYQIANPILTAVLKWQLALEIGLLKTFSEKEKNA